MKPVVSARRGRVADGSRRIEPLEARRLCSADFPDDRFASASQTYTMNFAAIGTLPIESISWGFNRVTPSSGTPFTNVNDFTVTLASGINSPALFRYALSHLKLGTVTIQSSKSSAGSRITWTLIDVYAGAYQQTLGSDGQMHDSFKLAMASSSTVASVVTQAWQRADGTVASFTYDFAHNTVSTSGLPTSNTDLFATDPSVRQTFEVGHGQVPTTNFSIAGDSSSGVGTPSDATFTTVDGLDDLRLAYDAIIGVHLPQMIFTQRDASGRPVQRYVHSNGQFTSYVVSDTVLDDQPRMDTFGYNAPDVQSLAYAYDGTSGLLSKTIGGGFNTTTNTSYTPSTLTAYVLPPTSQVRAAPLDHLDLHFSAPVTSLPVSALSFEGLTATGLTLTPNADGTVWTLAGNLAAQQTADGRYAVKLLAIGSGVTSADGAALVGSAGASWTLDHTPPAIAAGTFSASNPLGMPPQSLSFPVGEPSVATASSGHVPVSIRRSGTGALVATIDGTLDADGLTVRAALPAPLADGRYTATIAAGSLRDTMGNVQSADASLAFFVLAGDADRDAAVGFSDLLVLARHYGQSGLTFADGNFDYSPDGKVDFNDLLVLARRYGTSLPALAPQTTTAAAATRERRGVAAVVLA